MTDNVVKLQRPYEDPRHFHQRLRLIREVRGLSQSELARSAEMQPSAIAHFESGRRLPSFENLRALAIALRCTADYLLGIAASPSQNAGDKTVDQIATLSAVDREYVDLFVASIVARRKTETPETQENQHVTD